MRPHPRIRKTIKWGGLAVCGMLIAAYAISEMWSVNCAWAASQEVRDVSLSSGWIRYTSDDLPLGSVVRDGGPVLWADRQLPFRSTMPPPRPRSRTLRTTSVPLGLLIAIVIAPTFLAWRLDTLATRRAKLGACPTCSYPRAGLAPSSPCPECNTAAPHA